MGANMARRLMRGGHQIVAFDRAADAVAAMAKEGATAASSLKDVKTKLSGPRVVWVMLPAGEATEGAVNELAELLDKGDVVVDGGNSYFKDDVRRAKALKARGLHYIDAGVSGGIWGLERGYSLMVGASSKEAFTLLEPALKTLAPGQGSVTPSRGRSGKATADSGYLLCGPAGSGHFVKMIHNGIEYGMMQAMAEGFDIMRNANSAALPEDLRFDLELPEIAEVWRRGSVVSSWLLDLTAQALTEDPKLNAYEGVVADSGEGRWTVQAAIDEAVPADVLAASLFARFRSRQTHTFAEKVLSAMRAGFGGHKEPK
jgi:6-phosphogluconate dehydrogenase